METPKSALFSTETVDVELEELEIMPVTAWISLGLVLIGTVSIGMPQMLVFPLAGIALGLLALRPRAGASIVPLGRSLAYVGIVLGCFVTAASLGKWKFEQLELVSSAEAFGKNWLEIVERGEIEYAAELMKPRSGRQLPGADLKKYYENLTEDSRSNYDRISSLQAAQELEAGDKEPVWQCVKKSNATRYYSTYLVSLEYQDQTHVIAKPVKLEMKCEFDAVSQNNEWWVESVP